jgi:GT2 family glycosyltransferase/glycosyltransferase involved in cell wall biosynthesis
LQVLDQISRSNEAQVSAVNLAGLENALRRNRWQRLPVIGALLNKMGSSQNLHALENQLFRLNDLNGRRFDQIEKAITSLSQMIVHQAQTVAGAAAIQRLEYTDIDSWRSVENLLLLEDNVFLESLFQLALNRPPELSEFKHYRHLLEKGISKLHIIETIFSCLECKNNFGQLSSLETQAAKNIKEINNNEVSIKLNPVITESIRFPKYEIPLVSVIVPVFGKLEYTLMCLKSIQRNFPEVEFEIIIVDDCSRDNTVVELSKISGINLLVNSQNIGFIRSCNRGARHARGQFLCFLNNDTEVASGWLDELVRTFHVFPGTGLAGSKLVYPDGTLQEAGGILWQDGSAWNFGRGQSPDLPVFNYAREVDYCSGASIMVPASLFSELGGFDEYYLPAYCEDSDLALKIRTAGHRVIYQPMSVVIHHEGITSGVDTGQGTKAYQVANSKKLFERWMLQLANHQNNSVNPDSEKDRRMKHRVLVLEHCTPTPDQDAGSVSVFNMLLLLREMDFQVTFIAEDNFLYMPDYTVMLQRVGVEVLYSPHITSVEQHIKADGARYDLVFLFRPVVVERNIDSVRKYCPKAKVLFYTHDIHHIRMEREAKLLSCPGKAREAADMKAREFNAIRAVDSTIVVSTNEMEMLQPQLPDQDLQILPLILDVPGTTVPFNNREGIVFVGGYQHTPNVDAVVYFVSEIMPILRTLLPGVHFHAVGSNPPPSVMALAADDVVIEGFVEELKPLLDRMRISVAPLRYGAGVKGKVGTALACGLPTVATPIAAEGMRLIDGEQILIAKSPHSFAKAIFQLYTTPELWGQLSTNGIDFAVRSWGATAAYKSLGKIISKLGFIEAKPIFPLSMYSTSLHCKPRITGVEECLYEF